MKKFTDASAWILLIALSSLLIASCTTSKKFKTKQTEKIETSVAINTQTVDVNKTDSSSIVYDDSSFNNTNTVSIEFDNNYPAVSSEEKVNDYDGAAPKTHDSRLTTHDFSYTVNGNTINSRVPIKSINLVDQKTGKVTAMEIKKNITADSSATTASAVTTTSSRTTTTTKQKKTTSYMWIGIVLLCALGCWFAYQVPAVRAFLQPLFAIFRRRKKDNINNLNI